MAKADIWMPLYIGDYLADTTRLTTEQHGAYLLLIMDYWRNGSPPDDDNVLSSVVKSSLGAWKKMRPLIASFFLIENGLWKHSRIDREIEDAIAGKLRAETRAVKAAEARWAKHNADKAASNATSISQALPDECPSQSPSPSPTLKTKSNSKEDATATRLPADWMPTDEQIEFLKTERPELNLNMVAERFRDYWISQPGAKGRKVNWTATWRNWVRNESAPRANALAKPEKFDPTAYVNRNRDKPDDNIIDIN